MSKSKIESVIHAARSSDKISTKALIDGVLTDFMECHGDRYFGDDPAIIGGVGFLNGLPVTCIATNKGETFAERITCHFGCPEPEGYRKSFRLMEQAAKFNRPIITFINTAGAFPGMEAENRGQGESIAKNLQLMATLKVPIIAVITGEGGSGGALALASGDEVWMFENSIYSVLSPEGFATILWKDPSRSVEAAKVMKLTPDELLKAGVVEQVLPEIEDQAVSLAYLRTKLFDRITELQQLSVQQLLAQRKLRFRKF